MPCRERGYDATPGHGGLDGEVLRLQRGRIFSHHGTDKIQLFLNSCLYIGLLLPPGVAAGHHVQLQVLPYPRRGDLRLPRDCHHLLLHKNTSR